MLSTRLIMAALVLATLSLSAQDARSQCCQVVIASIDGSTWWVSGKQSHVPTPSVFAVASSISAMDHAKFPNRSLPHGRFAKKQLPAQWPLRTSTGRDVPRNNEPWQFTVELTGSVGVAFSGACDLAIGDHSVVTAFDGVVPEVFKLEGYELACNFVKLNKGGMLNVKVRRSDGSISMSSTLLLNGSIKIHMR